MQTVQSTCKGVIETTTRSLAAKLGPKHSVTIKCVEPGPVNTDLWRRAHEDEEYKKV